MLDRDRLLKISELDSDKIAQMDDNQFNSFAKTINDFIDGFPAQEADVKHALRNKNRGVLLESLIGICDMLKEINAVKLSNERLEQLSAMGNADFKDLQIFVINLLKSASALSIDLQMAECQDAGESQDEQKSLSKNNILVVDDRYFSLAFIKTMLNNTGYSVTCINSGVEAIEHLKSNCPDLFILDIEMPEMDGYQLARKIRESGHVAPIIFFTGSAKKDSVVRALEIGVADFIIKKSVNKSQLLERISKYIKPEISE